MDEVLQSGEIWYSVEAESCMRDDVAVRRSPFDEDDDFFETFIFQRETVL